MLHPHGLGEFPSTLDGSHADSGGCGDCAAGCAPGYAGMMPPDAIGPEPPAEEAEPPIGSAVMRPPHARFHPVPTQPVFAPRDEYEPPQPIMSSSPKPGKNQPAMTGEPTPAQVDPPAEDEPHLLPEGDSPDPLIDEPATSPDDAAPNTELPPPTALRHSSGGGQVKINSMRLVAPGEQVATGSKPGASTAGGWRVRPTRR